MATKKKRSESKRSSSRRRSNRGGTPRSYGEMYKNDTTIPKAPTATVAKQPASTVATPTTAKVAATTTDATNWRAEYDYVVRDLRTLLMVSAVLFAIIIIAGFFV